MSGQDAKHDVPTGADPVTLTIPAAEAWGLVELLILFRGEYELPALREQLNAQLGAEVEA